MNKVYIGVDIGGTKCAVTLTKECNDGLEILSKKKFDTPLSVEAGIEKIFELVDEIDSDEVTCIGISCGGPLNGKKGIIICPPNLPEWKNIELVEMFKNRYNKPIALKNDANAGALAEWYWGSGKGYNNIIFCTFGTGMGAGFILNGQLYEGTNDLAGEIGHMRITDDGPYGFDKYGSFEGHTSGGGIANYAKEVCLKHYLRYKEVLFVDRIEDIDKITTKLLGDLAQKGNKQAEKIFKDVSHQLGYGLSILIDTLNPELIILGSIYGRQKNFLEEGMNKTIDREAIEMAVEVCKITETGLGESIGDFAASAIAKYHIEKEV